MQARADVLGRSTHGSPCLVDALTRPHAEVADAALRPCHGTIDMCAGAPYRSRLASLLAGRQADHR
jgi:hypothetical protein